MNKLSVIIPVYKTRSELLHACVDNVLLQAQPDLHIELILVDDGCPDTGGAECEAIARDYNGGTRLKVRVIHQANGGPSAARNAGIAAAGGEFITFVDSDDVADPEIYGKVMKAFRKYPDVDCVIFGHEEITPSGTRTYTITDKPVVMQAAEAYDIIAGDNYRCGGGFPWNKVFRAETLRRAGGGQIPLYDPELFAYEDKLWCLEALRNLGSVLLIPETGYEYRRLEDSTSNGAEAVARRQPNVYLAFDRMMKLSEGRPEALRGLRVHLFKIVFTYMTVDHGGKAARTEMKKLLPQLRVGDFHRTRDKLAYLVMKVLM